MTIGGRTPPRIEDLRTAPTLGTVRAFGLREQASDDEGVPIMLHEHATGAFHMTMDALEQFARSGWVAGSGFILPGVALWYLTAEASASFAVAVARVHADRHGHALRVPRAPSLSQKLGAVRSVFGTGDGKTRSGSLLVRLDEFGWFRNALFHDLSFDEAADLNLRTYRQTEFAQLADLANEIDLLQSCVLATSACQYVRHVVPGSDLMPNVLILHEDAFVWERLDRLVREFVVPVFRELLDGKGLRTDVDLDVSDLVVGGEAERGVAVAVRAEPSDADYETSPVSWSPRERLTSFVTPLAPDPDTFRLPDYRRRARPSPS